MLEALGVEDDIYHPSKPQTIALLAEFLQTSPLSLYQATLHPFAEVILPPGGIAGKIKLPGAVKKTQVLLPQHSPWSGDYRNHLRDNRNAAYCPECLQQARYHRAIWQISDVSACLEHQRLLIEKCHSCGNSLGIDDVANACCSHCEADLTTARSTKLSDDPFGLFAQDLLQSWLTDMPLRIPEPYCLPDAPPRVLLYALEGLQKIISYKDARLKNFLHCHPHDTSLVFGAKLSALPVDQRYMLFASAFKVLCHWPTSFWDFIALHQQCADGKLNPALGGLGYFYRTWISQNWAGPDYEFIQRIFRDYALAGNLTLPEVVRDSRKLHERYHPSKYMTALEASRLLDVVLGTIQRMSNAGILTVHTNSGKSTFSSKLIRREQVYKVSDSWKDGVSLANTAHCLGLTEKDIVDLVNLALLPTLRGWEESSNPEQWLFSLKEIGEFSRVLDRDCQLAPARRKFRSQLISLETAAEMFSEAGIPRITVAFLIQGICTRQFRAHRRKKDEFPPLKDLCITAKTAEWLIERYGCGR